MTGRVGLTLYTWDYANRLATSAWSSSLSYTYDYLNRRTSTNWGGQMTNYISLGMHTIGERVGSTARDYVFAPGLDEPLAMVENGAASYYAVDGLGSIVATTDSAASVASTAIYDAWGAATYLNAPNGTGLLGYTGRENDVTGLLFFRTRWYVPGFGRFLSEDPLQSPSGAFSYGLNNLMMSGQWSQERAPALDPRLQRFLVGNGFHLGYDYVDNSPTVATDPDGLLPVHPYHFVKCLYYGYKCATESDECKKEARCRLARMTEEEQASLYQSMRVQGESDYLLKLCFYGLASCRNMIKECGNTAARPGFFPDSSN
jgi:RHS repeat-associated protein